MLLLSGRYGIDGHLTVIKLETGGVDTTHTRGYTLDDRLTLNTPVYIGGLPPTYQVGHYSMFIYNRLLFHLLVDYEKQHCSMVKKIMWRKKKKKKDYVDLFTHKLHYYSSSVISTQFIKANLRSTILSICIIYKESNH